MLKPDFQQNTANFSSSPPLPKEFMDIWNGSIELVTV
jgi:hypothetical protein